MFRGSRDPNAAASAAAEASKEAARIQRQGAVQAARITRSGAVAASKVQAAGALGVAVIAGMAMVINTSVQGCYSLRQAEVAVRASASSDFAPGWFTSPGTLWNPLQSTGGTIVTLSEDQDASVLIEQYSACVQLDGPIRLLPSTPDSLVAVKVDGPPRRVLACVA